jgi:hypothetical protein
VVFGVAALAGDLMNEYLREIDPELYSRIKDEEKLRKAEAALFLKDLRTVIRTPEGVRVIRAVLDRLGMFDPAFTGNSKTFYNLGRREAAQEIFADVALADPRGAQQILLEGYRRAARQKIISSGGNTNA